MTDRWTPRNGGYRSYDKSIPTPPAKTIPLTKRVARNGPVYKIKNAVVPFYLALQLNTSKF